MTAVAVDRLRVGYAGGPTLGIGETAPRLSWLVAALAPEWHQAAYEIAVDGVAMGRVDSNQSTFVPWPAEPMGSRMRRTVQVRVVGTDGSRSEWSDPLEIETGLLRPEDWTATWITPSTLARSDGPGPAYHLRSAFEVEGSVARARLYATSAGIHQLWLNGSRVADTVLEPGWTPYAARLRYATFDVTSLVHSGANLLGAVVADGWWRGFLTWDMRHDVYGDRLGLLAQLEITYEDGTVATLASDASWRASTGPVVAADLYAGETYDARLELGAWTNPGEDQGLWGPVEVFEPTVGPLVARAGPPVRRVAEIAPRDVVRSPRGRYLVDFGQNLVGWVRITVDGPAGTEITLRHAEVLEGGELGTRPLRNAQATDHYTLRGGGAETWEPSFTFHGFRYLEVDGWPVALDPSACVAVVVGSDLEATGTFECSNDLITKLHENVVWGMRGNFIDVPTDCPQRDERLGWTGDLQVFGPTASYLFDVDGMLSDWLRDLAAEQDEHGLVPLVVPDALGYRLAFAGWGDVTTLLPWVLYERYGDTDVLERQYDSMCRWVDMVAEAAGSERLWRGRQLGDWLDPDAPPDNPGAAKVDPDLVATAYLHRSAQTTAMAARILGRAEDGARFTTVAQEVRAAWRKEYLGEDCRLRSDAVTAYALAIAFALLDRDEVAVAAGHIARLAAERGFRISTGFLGTPQVLPALSAAGDHETAYRLLTETSCPSWLYPVTMGATTIWERWDSMLPDGSINPGEMTSFNHYALGSVADWLHQVVGGLAPDEPGYRRLRIAPVPGGGLRWARTSLVTPYGQAACSWSVADSGRVVLEVLVPPNSAATVQRPGHGGPPVMVGSGRHSWTYDVDSATVARWRDARTTDGAT